MGLDGENAGWLIADLETVAIPSVEEFLDPVEAPSNYKDPLKIEAYKVEKLQSMITNAGLEPDLCEIVALGLQKDGWAESVVLTRQDCDEAELIKEFWRVLASRSIIGFRSLSFDIPVLIRRSQLLGLAYPRLNLDRYRTSHVDLAEVLSFNGKLTWRTLKFYVRLFKLNVPPDPVSGADIASLVASGDWEAIQAHCAADVAATGALARRLGYL